MSLSRLPDDLHYTVEHALAEDIGTGDVTAYLVPAGQYARARVITREAAVICGQPWFDLVFRLIEPGVSIQWSVAEGARVEPDQLLCTIAGPARALLTGERSALNFLQTLSGTATTVQRYVEAVAGTGCRIVDTRKTLPGLRNAQKYAVVVGGGLNHRIGLYDGFLIKENHIAAAGGLRQAIHAARALGAPVPLMAEAENMKEARIAIDEDVDLLLIDDFTLPEIREAVALVRDHRACGGRTLVEYSGGATLETIRSLAETGVDRISVGALTKHLRAIDLSMRVAA
ncbi:nicotinate-nucleotide pyrophosphorylase [carboxylating] [Sphaerotilus hippei]|uniref:Probable nicotinate-nucleotide pyrophosphorylase [carboxylating] n=1 Tax=Sphaerotilus hippei TaxID=744406 RepID=A0A318GZ26_9BURK|nr:carboxylating nicotinate-nucleotide diphosphorylase [Sphaerotilus hippei]PXW94775.1 nicotinate-nucleotide pyrophosphorylase [carboxylating] [Sphaerotilus hippei]